MIETLARLISRTPIRLDTEVAAQEDVEALLVRENVGFTREHRLSERDRPDFMVDGIAIELKVKGSPRDIFRQVERYAAHPEVRAILLATNKAMTLPAEILGKPAYVVSLARGWL